MKDAVPNLLICCRFGLAGGKHEKQENERVADNTMMARRRSKRGRGDEPSTSALKNGISYQLMYLGIHFIAETRDKRRTGLVAAT